MLDIEIARNAASNGRLFNVMVFALLLALGIVSGDGGYFLAAILPALSVGAAYIGDLMRFRWMGWLSIAFAVLPLAFLIVKGL